MRVLLFALSLGLAAAPLVAQESRSAPTLVFTIYAGTSTGHELWHVDRQPLPSRGGAAPDTARLERRLESGLTAGLLTSIFPTHHIGLNLDIGFRTFGLDDSCAPVVPFQSDPLDRNSHLCGNINASTNAGSVLAVTVGVSGRIAPGGILSPYVRAAASLSHTTISTIGVVAAEPIDTAQTTFAQRTLILDENPGRTGIGATLAGGFTLQASPAYRFRLEIRDDIATHDQLTGPASATAIAPVTVAMRHRLGVLLGLDIVLEQKRPRRY